MNRGKLSLLRRSLLDVILAGALLGCGHSEHSGTRTLRGENGDVPPAEAAPDSAPTQLVPRAPVVEIRPRDDTIRMGQSVTLRILNRGREPVYLVPCSFQKQIRSIPSVVALNSQEWDVREISFCGDWNEGPLRLQRIESGDSLIRRHGPFDAPAVWRLHLSFRPKPGARYGDLACCSSEPFEVIE